MCFASVLCASTKETSRHHRQCLHLFKCLFYLAHALAFSPSPRARLPARATRGAARAIALILGSPHRATVHLTRDASRAERARRAHVSDPSNRCLVASHHGVTRTYLASTRLEKTEPVAIDGVYTPQPFVARVLVFIRAKHGGAHDRALASRKSV